MTTTTRRVMAILLVVLGVGLAASGFVVGGFLTMSCVKTPPDWPYYLWLTAVVLTLAAAVVPAVMLVRGVRGRRILLVFAWGLLLSCAGYGGYAAGLAGTC